jgi:Carboxypeptidase regulatory-like domain
MRTTPVIPARWWKLATTRTAAVKICLAASLLPLLAFAQDAQSNVSGFVRDARGTPIPDASVQAEQVETKLVRKTVSSSAGTFFLKNLPLGTYTILVTKQGFATTEIAQVRLLVGQTRDLKVTMQVAGQTAQISVVSNFSEVDQSSAAIGATITQQQIKNLPVNGRNWTDMLPLIPGATDPGSSDQRTVRFAGHGRDDNNITYDGVDATGISNQPQKTGIRLAIPTSTIAEFKVDSTLYTTDSADGTGGQVVLASVGGSNAFRGELFEFLRNDAFDARNTFAATNPPFRLMNSERISAVLWFGTRLSFSLPSKDRGSASIRPYAALRPARPIVPKCSLNRLLWLP